MYHKNFAVTKVFTRGNHSFVRFGYHNGVEFYEATIFSIFEVLKEFESEHPDRRITNWKTESYHVSGGPPNHFVIGIWIDHEPREEKVSISNLSHALGQD